MTTTLYVGPLRCSPVVRRLRIFDHCSPSEFKNTFDQITLTGDWWTNNPYIVDLFPAEQIIVCGPEGQRRLSDTEEWKRDGGVFTTGEVWGAVENLTKE